MKLNRASSKVPHVYSTSTLSPKFGHFRVQYIFTTKGTGKS